jgi:hypothetical protein
MMVRSATLLKAEVKALQLKGKGKGSESDVFSKVVVLQSRKTKLVRSTQTQPEEGSKTRQAEGLEGRQRRCGMWYM